MADALQGVRIVEMSGGVAGAYCAKLLADCGADVVRIEPQGGDPMRDEPLANDVDADTRGLYYAYLNAGKKICIGGADDEIARVIRGCDVLILGEDADDLPTDAFPRKATIDLQWFARSGPYANWRGGDVVINALAGMSQPIGRPEGPPIFAGDRQASIVGGITAYSAAMAGLLALGGHRTFEVSILEANIALAELTICQADINKEPTPRLGINRFRTCPVGIYACREGWIGVTTVTPAQWLAMCDLLGMDDFAKDESCLLAPGRVARVDELETLMRERFLAKTASEWAALGREMKIPLVVVPGAQQIIDSGVYAQRGTIASIEADGRIVAAPGTPFAMSATPVRREQKQSETTSVSEIEWTEAPSDAEPATGLPLEGLRVVDFSMGWAGPLATRMMADWGAEILKIEAGRYPDWWRGVVWTPEAMAEKQFEQRPHFSVMNRGKTGISLDLTSKEGLALALELVAQSELVIENQAAGVMARLGLGYETLKAKNPDIIMASASAFGSGNALSDTRAYGSTLEQGSGLPSFAGFPEDPPTMAHIAYGDAIGGMYGCASLLTALYAKRHGAGGQWLNMSQIECLLPFAAPAVLYASATGQEPPRRGNRHPQLAPHGHFPCRETDTWLAISVPDDRAWRGLCAVIGKWLDDAVLTDIAGRRARESELEDAIKAWTQTQNAEDAMRTLQENGVPAGVIRRPEEMVPDPHLQANAFWTTVVRDHVGAQTQANLPVKEGGNRYPVRGHAPYFGQHTDATLKTYTNLTDADISALRDRKIITDGPTQLRG